MMEKEFFKPTKYKIYLTIIIFILIVIFLFPAKINVYCKVGLPCPPINVVNTIYQIINEPTFVSINYSYILLELVMSYLLACSIINLFKKK